MAAPTRSPERARGGAAAERALRAATAAADRHDAARWAMRPPSAGRPTAPGPVAAAWAVAKLAAVGLTSPVVVPAVFGRAAAHTARVHRDVAAFPTELDRAMSTGTTSLPGGRVGRADATTPHLITSDLHRCVPGATDLPGAQGTTPIYHAMLEWYGARGWDLVENGDVEDYWLVGGSSYGVVYDAARMAGALLPGPARRRARRRVLGEHLRRIVDNNQGTYDRIQDLFHRPGRYRRLVGNHDDWYLHDDGVAALRTVHPGVDVHDLLVLDGPAGPEAVVAHGHHTDAWNAPGRDGLGKLVTSMGAALADAPLLSGGLGTPLPHESTDLLAGRHTDVQTVVNRWVGCNRQTYTVDETELAGSFGRWFGDGGPLLFLGHTHLPVSAPTPPARPGPAWSRYLNSGSGVHHRLVTALEWRGLVDGRPDVRLVAWHHADADTPDAAVVAEHDGRPLARRWFEPSADGRTLAVHPT